MVFQPDQLHTSAEGYRANARRLGELVEFMKQGGDWEKIDPTLAEQHRATFRSLQAAQAREYPALSFAQAAHALIMRFEAKAAHIEANTPRPMQELPTVRVSERAAPVVEPRKVFDRVRLPLLGDKDWDIVYVDEERKTYVLANPHDRRSPADIVSDVRSGRPGRSPVHEVRWDKFEELAKKAA